MNKINLLPQINFEYLKNITILLLDQLQDNLLPQNHHLMNFLLLFYQGLWMLCVSVVRYFQPLFVESSQEIETALQKLYLHQEDSCLWIISHTVQPFLPKLVEPRNPTRLIKTTLYLFFCINLLFQELVLLLSSVLHLVLLFLPHRHLTELFSFLMDAF